MADKSLKNVRSTSSQREEDAVNSVPVPSTSTISSGSQTSESGSSSDIVSVSPSRVACISQSSPCATINVESGVSLSNIYLCHDVDSSGEPKFYLVALPRNKGSGDQGESDITSIKVTMSDN